MFVVYARTATEDNMPAVAGEGRRLPSESAPAQIYGVDRRPPDTEEGTAGSAHPDVPPARPQEQGAM